jgi:tape measure domain-containing protein
MNNENGKVWFGIGLDTTTLQKDAQKANDIFRGISGTAVSEGAKIDSVFRQIGAGAAAYFSVVEAKNFASSIIRVRGEIESLEISFRTLLGSKEKGDALFSSIRQYAVNTPMEIEPLAKGAQTLLSFNIEGEKIMPILKQLGDISMGNSDKFNSLTLSFAQMSSTGRLMGQDLLQMINSGFNPLTIIAEQTGKSMGELKKEMEAGAISSDMVAKAFESATGKGGKFYGMLEQQSEGVNGSISNLNGAIDDMFNDLGSDGQEAFVGTVKGLTSIVEHYDKVGEAIVLLVGIYGSYKAALITTEAIRSNIKRIEYSQEIAELSKLIPAKQRSANADLEEAVACGRLTEAKAVEVAAIREEINIKLQSTEATKISALAEQDASLAAHKAALQRALASKTLVAQREMELSLATLSGNQAQIELAQKSLLTAQEQRNLAVKSRKITADTLAIAKSKAVAAASAVETLTTQVNTATQNANAASTKILTAVKSKLTGVATKLWGVIAANPFAAAAAAAVLLGYGIYKLITAQTAAEKAQDRLNKKIEEFNEFEKERKEKASGYIDIVKDETQAYIDRVAALENLKQLYPEQYRNMTMEQVMLKDKEKQLKGINEQEVNTRVATNKKYESSLVKELSDLKTKYNTLSKSINESDKMMSLSVIKQIEGKQKELQGLQLKIAKDAELKEKAVFEAKPKEYKIKFYAEGIKEIQKQIDELNSSMAQKKAVNPFYWDGLDKMQLDKLQSEKRKKQNDLGAERGDGKPQSSARNKAYWEQVKKDAEAARDAMDISLIGNAVWVKYNQKIKGAERQIKKYDDNVEKNTRKADLAKFHQAENEYKKSVKEQIYQTQMDIRQSEIDAMEEGADKEMSQIGLNYQRLIKENEKRQEEWVKTLTERKKEAWKLKNKDKDDALFDKTFTITDLSTEQQKALQEYAKLATEWKKKAEDDLLKELLNKYKTYGEQRIEINKKFDEEEKRIRESGQGEDVINGKLTVLSKVRKTALKGVSDDEIAEAQKSSALLISLFSNASDMSKKRMESTLTSVKKLMSYLQGVSDVLPDGITKETADKLKQSPEEIKSLYEQINELQSEYESRNKYPFDGFIKGLKKVAESSKLAKDAQKEVNKEFKKQKEVDAEIAKRKGIEYITTGAVEAANALQMVSEKFNELAEVSGDEKMKEIGAQLSSFSSLTGSVAQGFAAGGPWGAAASGVTNILSQTVDAFIQEKIEEAELLQSRTDFMNQLRLMDLQIKDADYETIFGLEAIGKASDAYKKGQEALVAYNAEVNKKMNKPGKEKEFNNLGAAIYNPIGLGVFGGGKSLTNEYKTLMAAFQKGYTELQGMAVKTKDRSGWSNFWGKKDQFQSLKEYAPELWGVDGIFSVEKAKAFLATDKKINDEQRKKIQSVIDLKDAYDANMEIVRKDIADTFGVLGTSITDSIVDSIMTGADAWQAFTKAGNTSLESLGKKLAYELFFAEKFKTLQAQLEETYSLGDSESVATAQMNLLSNFFGNIKTDMTNAQAWMEEWKIKAAEAGFDLWTEENKSQSGTSRGFNAMSQDTGDELNGRFTAIQMSNEEIKGRISLVAADVGSIKVSMGTSISLSEEIRNIAIISMGHLEDISKNTKELYTMNERLGKIEQNTSKL